ncbi:MAG: hypothetical protein ACLUR5_17005 [Eubacterium ventriosum]
MADENEVFTKAEELIEWLDENDILINLTDKEAGVLISVYGSSWLRYRCKRKQACEN